MTNHAPEPPERLLNMEFVQKKGMNQPVVGSQTKKTNVPKMEQYVQMTRDRF